MASLSPHRQALKDLAEFAIDAQFCQQYGTQVFNHSGEKTPKYPLLCDSLRSVIEDLLTTLQRLHQEIPSLFQTPSLDERQENPVPSQPSFTPL